MDRKFFFFDIDGTLTDLKPRTLIPSAKLAVQKLMEKGHIVSIATGRAYGSAKEIVDQLGIRNYVLNGGGCVMVDGKIIFHKYLDREKARVIVDEAEAKGYDIFYLPDDNATYYAKDDNFLKRAPEGERYFANHHYDEKYTFDYFPHLTKFYVNCPRWEKDNLTTMNTMTHLYFYDQLVTFQFDEKNEGIKKLVDYFGGDYRDVVTFGDEVNDLVMFEDIWFNVAMGNGNEKLKEKASYVAEANIDDGIYKTCEKFHWF